MNLKKFVESLDNGEVLELSKVLLDRVDSINTELIGTALALPSVDEDEVKPGYKYTKREAEIRRGEMLSVVSNEVQRVFNNFPELKTCYMYVAQYWNDEANDAVHVKILYSVDVDVDPLDLLRYFDAEYDKVHGTALPYHYSYSPGDDANPCYSLDYGTWDANGEAISLFSAFCKERGSQDDPVQESYVPYAHFWRISDSSLGKQVVGEMLRPWLDGINAEYDE